ncbi:hypothetical protein [Vallitalea guaymasensis]|uniref:Uncharacterized protein n=1 Tax=Vallitalea guaymasensis TaxID=1185412 RepID=A0A8J8ME06_9FIRM|nr:hypothetical protein [Vallitalea guaymasensis]QUH31099.1 hypothetical protein HYG85_20115 [Vallitalea guaymasensis]
MGLVKDFLEKLKYRNSLKQIDYQDLNKMQVNEVMEGLRVGLAVSQIKMYSHDILNDKQMKEIRTGMENGLSKLQVALYANKPMLTHIQMREVRLGLEGNLSNSQVEMYAKATLLPEQMKEIRKGFEYGLNKEQVEFLIDKSFLTPQQMREVRIGLENELPLDLLKKCIKQENGRVRGAKEIEGIRKVFEEGKAEISKKNIEALKTNLFKKLETEKPKSSKVSEEKQNDKSETQSTPEKNNAQVYKQHYDEMMKSYLNEAYAQEEGDEIAI